MEIILYTSESVADGHVDKVCDQISDHILDACLSQDPLSKVSVNVALKGNFVYLLGEVTTTAEIDFEAITKATLRDIGYDQPQWGMDFDRLEIMVNIGTKTHEIDSIINPSMSSINSTPPIKANDQGIMFGYACDESADFMPLPISLAHALMRRHYEVRKTQPLLGPDGKAQVTIRYENNRPFRIETVVFSSLHLRSATPKMVKELIMEEIILPVLPREMLTNTDYFINSSGPFTKGGPTTGTGLTGRKITVDTYGGFARHGGGAFSGKDPSKIDRSGAYAARQVARQIVESGLAKRCEVRLAYAIGEDEPLMIMANTSNTSRVAPSKILTETFGDIKHLLKPSIIIDRLQLCQPIYRRTSTFGHFGPVEYPWEQKVT